MTTTIFTDVHVFDGHRSGGPTSVAVDDGVLSAVGTDVRQVDGAEVVDGAGHTLLPGLIDAHVHLNRDDDLDALAEHGVTTAFDMASWPAELTAELRARTGTASLLSAGVPFIGPAGPHSRFGMPEHAVVTDPGLVAAGVARRAAEGSDYIKVVVEAPGRGGPEPEVVAAVVAAAHAAGLRVVAHASHIDAVTIALEAGADVLTHVPTGTPIDPAAARRMVAAGQIAIPTLSVSEVLTGMPGALGSYEVARRSAAVLREAGVTVLAGTDSVEQPGLPFSIPLGPTLHHELELMVGAGWSATGALQAATALPARLFGLPDRGVVEVGRRADLLLVEGDPAADITAIRRVRGVWIAGERVPTR